MGYILPDKMAKNHDGHCPACKKELTEEDKLDWRVLDSEKNPFTIAEWHYFISGFMIATIIFFWAMLILIWTGTVSLP